MSRPKRSAAPALGGQVFTDNKAMAPKLDLRRYFLRTYHAVPPRVFDACQGEGALWKVLRAEFPVVSYWGVDLKPKSGRLMIDSTRVLSAPGWAFDVIDVDTYGEPWSQWATLLRTGHPRSTLTVFLTVGHLTLSRMSRETRRMMGFERLSRLPPASLLTKASRLADAMWLGRAEHAGWRIRDCRRTATDHATYYGVRLERAASHSP